MTNEEIRIIHRVTTPIANGVTYIHDIFEDRQDGLQEAYTLKMSPGFPIHIDVSMPEHGGFGMQEPSRMARASVPEGNKLVAAINADFFNMTTGVPQGVVVRSGAVVKDIMPDATHFFGILKNGRYLIGGKKDFEQYRDDLYAAVGGRDVLIDGGTLPAPVHESAAKQNRHPRTGVGYDKDNCLYFVVVDGRNPGVSEGLYLSRFALYLHSMGLIHALNLDGGGSSTFALRLPGQNDIALMNTPSDGIERICANGLAVSIPRQGDSVCRQVLLAPHQSYAVPGACIRFSATGFDSSGNTCALPNELRYALISGQGSISADGCYHAPAIESDDEIALMHGDAVLGTTTVKVRIPTALKTALDSVLPPNSQQSIRTTAYYHCIPMLADADCFAYSVQGALNLAADGMLHTGQTGGSGELHVALNLHPHVCAAQNICIAYKPLLLDIYEGVLPHVQSANAAIFTPFDFSARHGASVLSLSGKAAEYSISQTYTLPAPPTTIGMWIRSSDGALPQATLTVQEDAKENAPSVFVKGVPSDAIWTYMEAPVSTIELPENGTVTVTIHIAGCPQCYIDSIRAVFGYTDDKTHLPFVRHIYYRQKSANEPLKITSYLGEDDYTPYEAPIDYKRVRVIVDDTELTNMPGQYGVNKGEGSVLLYNVFVAPGKHRFRICVMDLMNNQYWHDEIIDTNEFIRQATDNA